MKTKTSIGLTLFSLAMMLAGASAHAAAKTPVFYCSGTEPFWNLKVHPKGIKFETPYDQSVRYLEAEPQGFANVGTDYTKIYHTRSADSTATIIIRNADGKCSDGMSDKDYGYEVMFMDSKLGDMLGCCDLKME